jgi:spore coat polysaccharide biosynthesis protein SpsF
MNIDGMITVRSQSSRLPNKCYLPFGEGCVIEHVINRAKLFGFNPIVCTTTEQTDDRIVEIAKLSNTRYFRGSAKDKLVRWRNACREFDVDKFVTIDADDLFFDNTLTRQNFKALGNEYDLIKHPPVLPYEGCFGYSLTLDIIERACKIKTSNDTEMMWFFLEKVDDIKINKLQLEIDNKIGPIRLTLDYVEDYWLLCTVLRIIGHNAERYDIEKLFKDNPDLHKINWFRNDDYKVNVEKNPID